MYLFRGSIRKHHDMDPVILAAMTVVTPGSTPRVLCPLSLTVIDIIPAPPYADEHSHNVNGDSGMLPDRKEARS